MAKPRQAPPGRWGLCIGSKLLDKPRYFTFDRKRAAINWDVEVSKWLAAATTALATSAIPATPATAATPAKPEPKVDMKAGDFKDGAKGAAKGKAKKTSKGEAKQAAKP